MSEASGIQHAMRMYHIVICGLSGATMFFHILSQTEKVIELKMYIDFNLQTCPKHFSF